jgi:UDP-N-acetyl-D-glucosamine dehydrogenase
VSASRLESTVQSPLSTVEQALSSDALRVGVIGQGIVGAMTARLTARTGWPVIGYDRSRDRVAMLARETRQTPNWRVDSDPRVIQRANVLVIAVRIMALPDGTVDDRTLRRVCDDLAALEPRDRLVLLETTVPPGVTRRLSADLRAMWPGAQIHVAHCPERLRVGDSPDDVLAVPRLVGGIDARSTDLACRYLRRIGYQAVPVSSPEVAELSKLLENAFLTTGISLMSEVTNVAHALGISAAEVASAAATKSTGYYPFRPGAGIGGHCLGNDLEMLRSCAVAAAVATPLLDGVAAATELITAGVVKHLRRALAESEMDLAGATIWIIGVGFKVGSGDVTASAAIDMTRELRQAGAHVVYSDALVNEFEVDAQSVPRVTVATLRTKVAAAIVLSGDTTIDLGDLATSARIVLDLGGTQIMNGHAERVRTL